MTEVKEFVIDLFCGAGGTSEGVHLANCDSKVIACVNHDRKAIESHRLNHPHAKHFVEDIRNPEVVFFLKLRVKALRKLYPGCIITIWASLECTNFSKAKGGLPRDGDSRTLADHLFMYLDGLKPDYLMIENVVEFMSWGPLDENGKPISRKRGQDYLNWIDKVRNYGYRFDWKELNSADYGAYTSRNRYFAQFAKGDLPISWPEPTHTKNPSKEPGLFDAPLKKWKPVKEVLELENEGVSIFNRKKPLVDNTLKRIYAGLVKFVANGDDSFIKKYYSGRPAGKVISVNGPAGTVTTIGNQGIVKCEFMLKYNSTDKNGKHYPPSIDEPCPTVATQNRLGIVNANFLQSYYGNGNAHSTDEPCPTVSTKDRFAKIAPEFLLDYQYKSNAHSLDDPSPTIVTKDKFAKVKPQFLVNSYNGGGKTSDIEGPAPTVTNVPKSNLASCKFIEQQYGNSKPVSVEQPLGTITQNPKFAYVSTEPWLMSTSFDNKGRSINEPSPTLLASRKHHYILNPQYSNVGNSIDNPCPTIIARQDKKPLGLISCEIGSGFLIPVYEDDTETMIKIKQFMAYYGIVDIKMRMLEVNELLRIQGFPKDYKLVGNQTDQKKFIGNSVEVTTAKKIFEAHHGALLEYYEKKLAA